MTLVDTHTHLDQAARTGQLPGVLARAAAAGVAWMVTIGTGTDDWALYRDLAAQHPDRLRYTVGLHPCAVDEHWEAAVAALAPFWAPAQHRPVALGECGLDRFHLPKEPAAAARLYAHQQAAFAAQLELARRLDCPLVIHSRQAFADCVAQIDRSGVDWTKVVFHCFSEGEAEVRTLMARGGRASFTGILTYKNADPVRAAAKAQGLGTLMVETDAPWLAPVPHRGQPNEPAWVRYTAQHAATLLGVTLDELADATTANARAFYKF